MNKGALRLARSSATTLPQVNIANLPILSRPLPKNLIKPRIIAILGPTASGKSALAVKLAKKFNGEIVSADSRQAYRGMDVGTGKITVREMRGIPHHLLDVASPRSVFDVARYQRMAHRAIADILKHGKLPIVCGGTGLYIKAIVENPSYPETKPDWKLRTRLEKKTPTQLFAILKKLDPVRAQTIDRRNPRRLVRAIEIAKQKGLVPNITTNPLYDTFLIGIKKSPEELKKAILKRLNERMKKGMVREVKKLHTQGVSWKRMAEIGLEYKYVALYLQGKLTKKEMMETLNTKIWQYARRQMTWFRTTKNVAWITMPREAGKLAQDFLET